MKETKTMKSNIKSSSSSLTASTTSILLNCNICMTGLSTDELKKAINIINELGGKYCDNFSKSVSCLIVKKVGSKKHEKARELGIPEIELDWLYDCKSQNLKLSYNQYNHRAFLGCVISCTQLSPEERHRVKRIVEANGGLYSDHLKRDGPGAITHLVALYQDGEKYRYAKTWETIHIVTLAWIDDCSKESKWIPESKYIVLATKDSKKNKKRRSITNANIDTNNNTEVNIIKLEHLPSSNLLTSNTVTSSIFRRDIFYIDGMLVILLILILILILN